MPEDAKPTATSSVDLLQPVPEEPFWARKVRPFDDAGSLRRNYLGLARRQVLCVYRVG